MSYVEVKSEHGDLMALFQELYFLRSLQIKIKTVIKHILSKQNIGRSWSNRY